MNELLPEPSILPVLITNVLGLLILMLLYFFGVWSRSYILPADTGMSVKRQLVAAVPIGFVTMGLYAKSALPGIHLGGTGAEMRSAGDGSRPRALAILRLSLSSNLTGA